MSQTTERGAAARDAERLGRAIAVLVATGIALGLGYNALGRSGRPPRGLPWIAEVKDLPTLDEVRNSAANGAPPAQVAPRAGAPTRQVSDDPLAVSAGAQEAGAGLPEVPDVGRPVKIQLAAVRRFFDARAALFVDAREAADYATGHVPGAINLPFDESVTDPEKLEKVDSQGRPIIVYCGGNGCEVSIQMGEALVQAGHRKVLVDEGGFPEWEAASYPIAKGAEPGGGKR
ncbi:MAG: rhodanese-like domain-containing protein [Acidobacteriia bacterium]|nr:rhodanese-like domain-containing protein [Terriglobia bacterium]